MKKRNNLEYEDQLNAMRPLNDGEQCVCNFYPTSCEYCRKLVEETIPY
jgi:hypothetical protein